jgi:hypothetical protein
VSVMPSAHVFRVIVPVRKIDEAAAFYGAVLDALGRRVSPGRHYFGCGPVILACSIRRPMVIRRRPRQTPTISTSPSMTSRSISAA